MATYAHRSPYLKTYEAREAFDIYCNEGLSEMYEYLYRLFRGHVLVKTHMIDILFDMGMAHEQLLERQRQQKLDNWRPWWNRGNRRDRDARTEDHELSPGAAKQRRKATEDRE